VARHWRDLGAQRLHLVDLDGARDGRPQNEALIARIVQAVGEDVPVQLGGGIRDMDTIERYLDIGLRYVVIGTAAVKNPGFLQDACSVFQGHIMVGLDARDGKVAVDGWSKLTRHDVFDIAHKFEDLGVEAIIYTDISRDGMMGGVNLEATRRLAAQLRTPVIASGGINNLQDVRDVWALESDGVSGVITGRAIYEGTLDFKAAVAMVAAPQVDAQ
jgi:phosphoribosylformimino-5-aminoimidazole carboxamide ribotide isomerase